MPVSTKVRARYELREVLSKGGMGVVYRAWDTLMKRDVALKTILDVHSRSAFDMFYKEWGLQASIIHPNIIEIYDIGEFEDSGVARPYFVMPLLPGTSLAELIKNASHRLTVERSVEIMNQVCRGLQAAHERGLIHRDIKPSNVFVMADDSVKIIDFGIAFTDTGATHTAMRGTLPYMAPELLQLKPPSVLTDIFSLGAVAYEALTRRRAFEGKTDPEISNSILRTNPPPACDLNPSVTLLLSQVVHKAMAKQPWHRYASAREFGETLLHAVHNEPIPFFDRSRVLPRIERASRAFERGEYQFATEILEELEGEGHIDPEIAMLRRQVEQAGRQTTVKQILESARRFYEEDEYALSLRKIQEALELDPDQSDALALKTQVEKNRRSRQLEEWTQLARQHLENNAFQHARGAIQNLLEVKPDDTAARDLLAEINRRAQAFEGRRQEKSKLYDEAAQAWQKGEVNAALSKLERWLVLDREVPDTDAARVLSCQNFYKQVRTEDEAVRNALDQARKLLAEQSFTQALEICDQYLARYPSHALFQALRFDIEERRRKNLSALIADTDRRVETEPDIEKRCSILEDAARQYPGEPHFERALRLARDKRNLVNSVVQRARSQEEQGKFAEAIESWEMLRAIYSQYPGLDFEISRATKRRDADARNEARLGWVDRIDRLIEARDFDTAASVAQDAMAEFPDDLELKELERLACKRIATSMEAAEIVETGRKASLAGQRNEGLKLMREALDLDPANPTIRSTLLDALIERAREIADRDPSAADGLAEEIVQLDPENSFVAGLRNDREEAHRTEFVYWCTAQARRLQAAGDGEGALAVVQEGLANWPQDPGLLQLARALQREVNGTKAPSAPPPPPFAPPAARIEPRPGPPPLPPPPEDAISASTEFSQFRPADTPGDLASGVSHPAASLLDDSVVHEPLPPPYAAEPAQPQFVPPPPPAAPGAHTIKGLPMWQWVTLACIAVVALAFLARYLATHAMPTPQTAVVTVPMNVITTPPGAHIIVDGQDRGIAGSTISLPPGTHSLQALLDGYAPESRQVNLVAHAPQSLPINLTPLPSSLRLITDADTPSVKLDDQSVAGAAPEFALDRVETGHHKLTLTSRQGQATFQFDIAPGNLPAVTGPVQTKNINALVLTQFGSRAWLYASEPFQVGVDSVALTATPAGVELPALPAGTHSLTLGEGPNQRNLSFTSSAAPALVAFVEQKAAPETGSVLVLTGEDGATVLINGKPQRKLTKNGQLRVGGLAPGDYTIRATREGFEAPAEQKIQIAKGRDVRVQFQLKPVTRMATLRMQGVTAGAQVLIDENTVGSVQPDGSFSLTVAPGAHTVMLRNSHAQSRAVQHQFGAGQTLVLSAGELAMQATQGTLHVHVSPASAHLTIRAESEHESAAKPLTQETLSLPEGTYIVSASAPEYNPSSRTVTIGGGAQAVVEISLTAKAKKAPAAITGMGRWDDAPNWSQEGEWQIHKGGNFLSFQADEVHGRIEFNALVRKGKRLEWFVARSDDRNYLLFRLDKKNLVVERYVNGRSREVSKTALSFDHDQPVAIRIEVTPGAVNTSVRQGSAWTPTDAITDAEGNFNHGHFGLHIPGHDEIGLNSFAYYPR